MLVVLVVTFLLNGCVTQIWTGVSLVYNRHSLYHEIGDYRLGIEANHLIFKDELFRTKLSFVDVAAFNGDLLLAGHVPTQDLKQELIHRVSQLSMPYHLYNEVVIGNVVGQSLNDTWITTNIRTQIFADSSIDPHAFKVVTTDGVVYLMGEARPAQAKRVIQFARETEGVRRVVTLLKYYQYVSPKGTDRSLP
ncbi:MAG: BON domain-containing protein [Gammaproteobacteria bacterium]|nr:BON domain-containing protein [Gammaproteobacteria bacterium]